ncbi:hypothetical protein FE257_003363 [Aspergillus nanangensis]|uniref:Uncharacterized protein n=1 Tax=Aspergillus nanangensis TaxID=2582783 RepID=A0AAD4CBP8_ASPNN|nr:hypothetical protein FE257_003363 [Aspergillus nanangensis]
MQRALFTEEEVRLATERRLKYLGTAKVHINQIEFDPPLPRDVDQKNVNRLCEIFRKNRCRRLDVDNHVPATVSQHGLSLALQKANVPRSSLLTSDPQHLPLLGFSVGQLRALHGRHRVQAGAEMLPPADRWWTVDLYLDDLGEGLKTSLIEEYSNEKKPTDGEIYRKIRQYEGEDNEVFRQRWFVRLSPSNQNRLDQLDNRRNRRLRRAFDRLLAIPGLWPHGMRISMLHRLVATGCVEEILSYLDHIRDFWSSLVASSPLALKKIDADTIEALQLMAPGKCQTDARKARGLVLGGEIFAEFNDGERRIIWDRMQSFDALIPSLYTFFEDFKYLESCSHCIKRLFGPLTSSVWQSMSSIFVPSEGGESVIQTSESTFRSERVADTERLDKGYLQIWLYAMRHYPLMPPDPKNDDDLLAKPARGRADDRVIYEMAELARQLGFDSPEIRSLTNGSPDYQIARAALLQARKPGRFQYDPQHFNSLINRVVECFAAAVPEESGVVPELLADSTVKARARCGMPQMRTHKQDSPLLFLDRLHEDFDSADTITTFFVRRCVYFAFFGKPSQSCPADHGRAENPPADVPPKSPLFVSETEPSDGHELGQQVAPQRAVPLHDRGQLLRSRSPPESSAEREQRTLQQQRRTRKIQARRRRLQLVEVDRTLMEVDQISSENSDEAMSEQEPSNLERSGIPAAARQIEAIPSSLALLPVGSVEHNITDPTFEDGEHRTPPLDRPDLIGPDQPILDGIDASSQCTRISLGAVPPVHDSNQHSAAEDSVEEGSDRTTQQDLNAYLDQLQRAQDEQNELEERLERERLEEELHLPRPEQPVLEPVSRSQGKPSSLPGASDDDPTDVVHDLDTNHEETAIYEPSRDETVTPHREEESEVPQSHCAVAPLPSLDDTSADSRSAPASDIPQRGEASLSSGCVGISFWSFEREEWNLSDYLEVDPADPSPVERVAKKYTRKDYSLYDKNLQSLSPAQCYRAATTDNDNSIFIISDHEEQKLMAEGRFVNDKKILSLVFQVLDHPGSPVKRLRFHSVSSEEL